MTIISVLALSVELGGNCKALGRYWGTEPYPYDLRSKKGDKTVVMPIQGRFIPGRLDFRPFKFARQTLQI